MTQSATGRIVEVSTIPIGDIVVEGLAGQSAVVLNSTVDFNLRAGQTLQATCADPLDDTTMLLFDVTDVNHETDTLTLSTALPDDLPEGWPFLVYPTGDERVAQVLLDEGDDEPIACRVPHSLYDRVPEGVREPDAEEAVEIAESDDGEWAVVDVLGQVPLIDGSYIDAETLPPPSLTDGDAPVDASTVTFIGGIGSVFFRWTEVVNADPVTYRLHVRAGSAPTTDGTYEVASGVGLTFAAVRKLKDGSAIVGDGSVTYYGVVTVEDADGPGPASSVVSGVPAQVTTADIAVNAITANLLTANDAIIDALFGTTITGVTITGSTVQTAATGGRWVLSSSNANSLLGYTGASDELSPSELIVESTGAELQTLLTSPALVGYPGAPAKITLAIDTAGSRSVTLEGDFLNVGFGGEVALGTVTSGAIGPGTFRDAVDGRVAAGITGKANTADVTSALALKANTADVAAALALKADLASPTFTGTVNATMGDGDLGVGTFSDNLDDRISDKIVELTPAQVFAAAQYWHVASTGDATPTSTTNVTIPGMSQAITAVAGAVYRVDLDFDQQITTAGATNIGELLVDGVQTGPVVVLIGPANARSNNHRTIFVTGLAAGTRTFTARTRSGAAATTTAVRVGSTLTIQRVK